eukprot:TRINITY_DN12502_c0_g1_i1.p1 TRINITY_DN12502_c0_g1~~TRINITY_DN12502_c0_g1_i1.p1  ORF type:complete len:537 (+),score=80.63 TRINITY_DN12502_c0_g1_i1:58-1668(+)
MLKFALPAAVLALASGVPVPTGAQLEWYRDEVTAIGHFNMGTFQACGIGGIRMEGRGPLRENGVQLPPPETFAPTNVNVTQWTEALGSFGVKHAVLVVSHGCGFNTFPSDTSFPEFNFTWSYSVKNSPWMNGKGDIARLFVDACKKYGIKPGFYHGIVNNAFLNVVKGIVQPNPQPGQANITQEQYVQVVTQNLRQLWTNYGQLAEVWFDGGMAPETSEPLLKLLNELQPNTVAFQGPGKNVVRWCGTESGHPQYPLWSTANSSGTSGQGSPDAPEFVPAEVDTCFQTPKAGENTQVSAPYGGCWFYNERDVPKSVAELASIYADSVGNNANLLLDWSPQPDGTLRQDHIERYQEFGKFLSCYETAKKTVGPFTSSQSVDLSDVNVERVAISEDLTNGQLVRSFDLYLDGQKFTTGSSVGHKRIVMFPNVTSYKSFSMNITGAVSTPKVSLSFYHCMRFPAGSGCGIQSGFAFIISPGNLIRNISSSSVDDCCKACRADSACSVFVDSPQKVCSLLSSQSGLVSSPGYTSGTPLRQ